MGIIRRFGFDPDSSFAMPLAAVSQKQAKREQPISNLTVPPGSAPRDSFDVVMLTTVHKACDDRIFHREARTLAEAGLSVCIVGNHPKSEIRDGVWIESLPRANSRWRRLSSGWSAMRAGLRLKGRLFIFHDPELF